MADVLRQRPVEGGLFLGIGELLLDDMGGPAGNPRHRKDRRHEVEGNAHQVVNGGAVKIDVGPDRGLALRVEFGYRSLLDLRREPAPMILMQLLPEPEAHILQEPGTGVHGLVYRMAHAHDLPPARKLRSSPIRERLSRLEVPGASS